MTMWLSVSACNVTQYMLRELPWEIANTEGTFGETVAG
jgi:hypothetical protein